jgi:hypothetical protein
LRDARHLQARDRGGRSFATVTALPHVLAVDDDAQIRSLLVEY